MKRPENKELEHGEDGCAVCDSFEDSVPCEAYNEGFNHCHDLDTIYITELLKPLERWRDRKALMSMEEAYELLESIKQLIEGHRQ